MNKKGFFITLDSFFAITLLMLLVLLAYFYVSGAQQESWNSVDLKNFSYDYLSILERNDLIENAILQGSSSLLQNEINNSPEKLCLELSIYEESNFSEPIVYALKSNCTKYYSNFTSVERTIVVFSDSDAQFYVARLGGWYP